MSQNTHLEMTRRHDGDGAAMPEWDGAERFPGPRLVEQVFAGLPAPTDAEGPGPHDAVRRAPSIRARPAMPVTAADSVVDRVARSRVSVLITGETGSGKEVLAQRIHASSPRAAKPLVSINCAAVCESLIDSQLFGYQRGAFTGADHNQTGIIEAADGGTLFLDEVGELSASAQAKLLRVLESRVLTRVGGVSARPVDVRFIAATNRNLDQATADRTFRADLLYRLDGVRLSLLPLRSRTDEILPAARQFLDELAKRDGLTIPAFSSEAKLAMLAYSWPGNFRELRNVVERAAIICEDGCIEPEHLLLPSSEEQPAIVASAGSEPSASVMRQRIHAALAACAGNQTRAAEMLGMSRRTFITRLEALGIPRPRIRPLRAA